MTTRTLTTAATLVTAAALLLTACGGSSKAPGSIQGAQSDAPTSASPSTSAPAGSPTITLPKDDVLVFEGQQSGDPAKDAVLADNAQFIRATDDAIVRNDPSSKALAFYAKEKGLVATIQWVKTYTDSNTSVTGTVRYYNRKVTFEKDGSASLIYCGDESKGYDKDRKTGKIANTPASKDSYIIYNTRLEKDKTGVWQTADIISQRGAAQCQP